MLVTLIVFLSPSLRNELLQQTHFIYISKLTYFNEILPKGSAYIMIIGTGIATQ